MDSERLLTLRQAAEATDSTVKALRSRAERGSLRTVKRERGGQLVRLVPRSELIRAGLLADVDTAERAQAAEATELREQISALRADLTNARALTEKAQSREAAESVAHDQTRGALHEARADAEHVRAAAAEERDELRSCLDEITNAGPIRAFRLRRKLRAERSV
jgi:hypothetical protein